MGHAIHIARILERLKGARATLTANQSRCVLLQVAFLLILLWGHVWIPTEDANQTRIALQTKYATVIVVMDGVRAFANPWIPGARVTLIAVPTRHARCIAETAGVMEIAWIIPSQVAKLTTTVKMATIAW